jgi:hypothetical protein
VLKGLVAARSLENVYLYGEPEEVGDLVVSKMIWKPCVMLVLRDI